MRWSEGSHYELTAQIVHDKPNAPVLIYTWTVQEILQKVDEESPRIGAEHLHADKSQDFVRIEKTDVWDDDLTLPSYLLRCRMKPVPRSMVRSLGKP